MFKNKIISDISNAKWSNVKMGWCEENDEDWRLLTSITGAGSAAITPKVTADKVIPNKTLFSFIQLPA